MLEELMKICIKKDCSTHRNHCHPCPRVLAIGQGYPADPGMHWGRSAIADCPDYRVCHHAGHHHDPMALYRCCSSPHQRSDQVRVSVEGSRSKVYDINNVFVSETLLFMSILIGIVRHMILNLLQCLFSL